MFGHALSDSILTENETDAAAGITAEQIQSNWAGICDIIRTIPTAELLLQKYDILDARKSLSQISVPEELKDKLLDYSPLVRNRLTLMRLRRAL